jgi:periplasmic protein TonB
MPPPELPPEPVAETEPAPVAEEEVGEEPPAEPAGQPQGRETGVAGGNGDAIHELREVARPPVVIEQVLPEYPRAARSERIVGLVVLRVVIGADGRVESARTKVVRSVPELDAAAIAAIEKWRFSPAIGRSGQPVRVVIEVPFQFSLR